MNIPALIEEAKAAGVRVYLRDGKVKLRGSDEAMEAIKPRLAPHKDELLAYLSDAERQAGEFWPWAPYLTAVDVERFRAELAATIERLADMERWSADHREDVIVQAIRSPLADLLPNLHYFNQRLAEANAAAAVRSAVHARSWRYDR